MPQRKGSSFADDLAAVLATQSQPPATSTLDDLSWLTAPRRPRSFADDLAALEFATQADVPPTPRTAEPSLAGVRVPFTSRVEDLPTLEEMAIIAASPVAQGRTRRAGPPPVPKPVDPPRTFAEDLLELPGTAARGFMAGAAAPLVESISGLATSAYAESPQDVEALMAPAAAAREATGIQPELRVDPWEQPDVLTDPRWWAYHGSSLVGSVASLAGTGVAGRTAALDVARRAGLHETLVARLANVGGASAAAGGEAFIEASNTFADLVGQGKTPNEASTAAAGVFASNLALLGLSNHPLFREGGRAFSKVLTRALSEGGQEVAQQGIGNVAAGRPVAEGMGTAAILGAVGGPAAGAVLDAASPATASAPREPAGERATTFGRRLGQTVLDKLGLTPRVDTPAAAAPAAPVSDIVEPQAAPPAPEVPIVAPEQPGGSSFAEDLAAVQPADPRVRVGRQWVMPGTRIASGLQPDITGTVIERRLDGGYPAALVRMDDGTERVISIARFLNDGWAPVRETGSGTDSPVSVEVAGQAVEPDRSTPPSDIPVGNIPAGEGSFAADLAALEDDDIPGKPGQLNVPAKQVEADALSPEERRELRRILEEMESAPFTKHTFDYSAPKQGGTPDIIPGNAGAPVYTDIVTTDRRLKPQGTRPQVAAAIRRLLSEDRRSALSDRAVDVARRRLAGYRTLSKPIMPPEAGDVSGVPMVRRRSGLTDEQKTAEATFARRVEEHPREAIDEYRQRFVDNVVSADRAKELSPDYRATNEAKTRLSTAVHNASQTLAHAVYRDMLYGPTKEGRQSVVVFTAGGTGSGKTSSLNLLPELRDSAHLVYDSTLSNFEGAVADIDAALEAGHEVGIVFTMRDPEVAFRAGVLSRAMKEGRVVTALSHARTHTRAPQVFERLRAHYAGDERVNFLAIDNTGPSEDARTYADVAAPGQLVYNEDDVRASVQRILDEERAAGHISEEVYRHTTSAREGVAEAPDRPGHGPDAGQARRQARDVGGKARSAAPAAGTSFRDLPQKQSAGGTLAKRDAQRLRPSAIIERLRQVIGGVPNRTGHFNQRALGIYKPDVQAIRLKLANDLQTFFHESGHHVDLGILKLNRKDARWKGELERLGVETSRPSYTKKQVREEGAAEFLRRWITEPDEAQRRAPNYFAAFEAALEQHPELLAGLRQAQADVQALVAMEPADRARLKVDFEGSDPGPLGRAAADPRAAVRAVATQTIDDLWALRYAVDQMRDGRVLNDRENAYVLARIARGSAGKAEAFLERGVRMRNGQFNGPTFTDAIKPVKDHLEDFGLYLVALRAKELHARGIEPGLTPDEAAAVIERTKAREDFADFEIARDRVYGFQDALLEYARQYGALSKDQLAAIKALNEFYVPMQRLFDATEAAFTGAAQRIADRALPVKRIKGSGREIINPFESIVKNTFAIVDMVEKNRAMQALVRQAERAQGSARWIEKIPAPQVATQFNLQKLTGQVRSALDEAGVDLPDNLDQALDELVTVFTPATFGNRQEQIVTVIRNGERQFWQVNDRALYDAITVMGPVSSQASLHWLFRSPVKVLRAAATLTPGFILRNPGRDTFVAYLQSRYGFIPVYDTLRGLVGQLRGDEDAKQFFASGIAQATLSGQHRQHRRELVKQITQHKGEFLRYAVWHPIDLLRALSAQFEVATRLGEFKLALDAGGAERGVLGRLMSAGRPRAALNEEVLTRATLAARDVTTDFARAGRMSREANELYAFFNARVQGYVRMGESVQRDPVGVLLRLGSLGAFSAALWWMNHDDEEYRRKEDWEKQTYWHLKLPGNDWFIKIPKPFEWGYVPDIVEATLSYLHEQDPASLDTVMPNLGSAAQVAVALAPTAIAPLLEAGVNYDAFRDTHIIRPWDLNLDPELQVNQWTSEVAKKVGKVTNTAPLLIDHIIFGYTAGFGRGVVEGIDTELRQVGIAPADKRPSRSVNRWPVIGTFVDDGEKGFSSKHIRDLYETAEAIERLESSTKQYVKAGQVDRARARVAEDRDEPWFDRRAAVKAAAQSFRELSPTIKAIYAAPPARMSPAEKRQRLDAIAERMDAIAQRALGRRPHRDAEGVQPDVLDALGIAR